MTVINEDLLAYLRLPGPCDFCGKMASVRQPHHLRSRGMGGGSRLDIPINLAALHPECHCHVQGNRLRETICLQMVADRLGIGIGRIVFIRDQLLRLPKDTTEDELEELGLLRWVIWKKPAPEADGSLPF